VTLLKNMEPAVNQMCLDGATNDTVQQMQSEAIIAMVIQPLKVYFLHQIFSRPRKILNHDFRLNIL
jgi:hypothetical protein